MTGTLWNLARRGLFRLDPETAHGLSIQALKTGLMPAFTHHDPRLVVNVAGLQFGNPVGLAAGYDKNAEVPQALLRLGFGFVEVGTLTPKPQAGNPRPRIFRLVRDEAIINRLGFNNEGHQRALERLKHVDREAMVGVNIGANKDSLDRIADYVAGIQTFASVARYFTINISSPNTPGLRDLQGQENLAALLSAVMQARQEQAITTGRHVPVFLKIAPDLGDEELDDIAAEALSHTLDGLIISNTTLCRHGLREPRLGEQAGGLSGRPLFEKSTVVLAKMRQRIGPKMALIGVGGVHSAQTAASKIRAGADLVQLYSAMIFAGPGLIPEIIKGLSAICDREGLASIADLRDQEVDRWVSASAI